MANNFGLDCFVFISKVNAFLTLCELIVLYGLYEICPAHTEICLPIQYMFSRVTQNDVWMHKVNSLLVLHSSILCCTTLPYFFRKHSVFFYWPFLVCVLCFAHSEHQTLNPLFILRNIIFSLPLLSWVI